MRPGFHLIQRIGRNLHKTKLFPDKVKSMSQGNNPGVAVLENVVPAALLQQATFDGLELDVNGRSLRLRAVWAGEGFPNDIRRVLAQTASTGDGTPVVTARRLSPGAIRLLAAHGISWADAAGYAEITSEGLFLNRAAPKPLGRATGTAVSWSTTAEIIAEYLVSRTQSAPTSSTGTGSIDRAAQIAEATHISSGQVAKVLAQFDEEGYTAKSGPERGPTSTRELRDPARLLSDWAGQYSRSPRKELGADFHVLSRDPGDWAHLVRVALGSTPWAASGWSAADAIAPFATSVPDLLVYVPDRSFAGAVDALTAHDDLTPSERGARIRIRSAPEYIFGFAQERRGLNVASPVRVYADLLRAGGRGPDVGEHLREVAIGY